MARDQDRFAQTGPRNIAHSLAKNGAATHPALHILVCLLARHAAAEDAAAMQKGPELED